MPNHVKTRCKATGPDADVAAFRELMFTTKEGAAAFTFDRLIPMPEVLASAEEGGNSEVGLALIIARGSRTAPFATLGLYDWEVAKVRADAGLSPEAHICDVASAYLAAHPDIEAAGLHRLRALHETGYASWYPWALRNWGTKWDAYSSKIVVDEPGALEFTFDTAWSFPVPVFEALAARFPYLSFQCATFDEGSNFSGVGFFNPKPGQPPFSLTEPADEALYAEVYGYERDVEECE